MIKTIQLLIWLAMFTIMPTQAQAVSASRYVATDAKLTHVNITAHPRTCGFWRKRCRQRQRAHVTVLLSFDYVSLKSGEMRRSSISARYSGGLGSLPGFFTPRPKVGDMVRIMIDREEFHAAKIPCTKADSWFSRLAYCKAA